MLKVWGPGACAAVQGLRKFSPKAQNSPKALFNMIFGPKILRI